MIFVTVGTQKQQFLRLFDIIKSSKELEKEEIFIQAGNTKYIDDKMNIFSFISPQELEKFMEKSDYIICHGGAGSIVGALKLNKKVLVVPRLSKYKEHINDHQLEISQELEKEGYLIYLRENQNIDEAIVKLKNTEFKKYVSETGFLEKLRREI